MDMRAIEVVGEAFDKLRAERDSLRDGRGILADEVAELIKEVRALKAERAALLAVLSAGEVVVDATLTCWNDSRGPDGKHYCVACGSYDGHDTNCELELLKQTIEKARALVGSGEEEVRSER